MVKKVAIYIRVSTHHQIDKDSLPLQRKDLINYCEFILNSKEYEVFEDAGYSGKNTDRPKYQEMMSRIRNEEFSHLLVWKIDRISRNLLDFCDMYEELKKYNCIFVSKNEQFDTSSAMGEAMLKIILVFAELERKLTGERVTAIMMDRASKGLWNGAPIPLGYKWDNKIKFPVPDENEVPTVLYIYKKYLELQSTSRVRAILNSEGYKTKKDGTWTTKTITDIIRNPFYKGTYRYNYKEPGRGKKKNENEWIIIEDNHQGIIDKDLWEKCNNIMDINSQRSNAQFRSNTNTHVFSGLIECGECHKNYYGKQDKANKDGFVPSLYVCRGRYNNLGCSQKTISDKYVGTFIITFISNILKTKRDVDIEQYEKKICSGLGVIGIKQIDILYNATPGKHVLTADVKEKKNVDTITLEKEKSKYQRALQRLDDLYLFDEESMSKKDYIIKKNKIEEKIKEIDNEIKTSQITSSNDNIDFINAAKIAILHKNIFNNDSKKINYKDILIKIGRESIKDFMNEILTKIIVKDRKIIKVIFKNGLECEFIYT